MPKTDVATKIAYADPAAEFDQGLYPEEKRFADAYLGPAGRKGDSAYQIALGHKGTKQQVAAMLGRDRVRAYIKRRSRELAAAAEITAERVLLDLQQVLDMSLGRADAPIARIANGELVCDQGRNFDAAGATRALELMGKYLGMWRDRVEHTGDIGGGTIINLNLAGRPPEKVIEGAAE